MKKLLLLAAMLLPAWVLGADTNVLRVLSYNIHIGRGLDGRYDLDRIARVIREADVDLVALQEVDRGTRRSKGDDQPAELAKRLPGYTPFFAAAMPHDGGEYGECLLSRLPVRATRRIPLPAPAGNEPRAAAVMEVERGGRRLLFIGTHLDHLSGDLRAAQLRQLAGDLATGDGLTVLAGDFNAGLKDAAMEALKTEWRVLWAGDAPPTYPADAPSISIDHIWVRPAASAPGASLEVLNEPVASDHRPVRAVIPW